MPWLPDLHSPAEDVAFFMREIPTSIGWIAADGDRVVGFALTRDGWLNHLFVDTPEQGRGIGTELLAAAVAGIGPGMRLWAFQRNERARTFYARHGFVEAELTDGAGNEEKEPDVLLRLP